MLLVSYICESNPQNHVFPNMTDHSTSAHKKSAIIQPSFKLGFVGERQRETS